MARTKSHTSVETLENFLRFGDLNDYQVRALKALILEGKSAAPDIAEKSKIPKTKIYQILKELEDKELIYCPNETARKKEYVAVAPQLLMPRISKKYEEFSKIKDEISGKIFELYEGALQGSEKGDITNYIKVIEKYGGLRSEIFEGIRQATNEILCCGSDFTWARDNSIKNVIEKNIEKDITMRCISTMSKKTSKEKNIKDLKDLGVTFRYSEIVNSPFIVIDEKEVYLALRKRAPKTTTSNYIMVKLYNNDVARDLKDYFERIWDEADH